jgi:N-acetyl-alpha-D-muramate 1-phosphate uridylyltransferase
MRINAMIFAAGVGSRLKPLTNKTPKALIEIDGHPLLEFALKKLERLGIPKVIVNVHHHADQILSYLNGYKSSSLEILISDESAHLMDTGGGLVKASNLFDKNAEILIYNADILTNANLQDLINFHKAENNLVSLFTENRSASRYLLFDENAHLVGWQNPKTGEEIRVSSIQDTHKMGFNGVQIVNHRLLSLIGSDGAFPIIPEYLELAKDHKIKGWDHWTGDWFDIGTPEKLEKSADFYAGCLPNKKLDFF